MNFTAEDRGDHYLIDEGDGPFKLAKAGLDPDVEAKVRASIGSVPGFSGGGIVPAPILTPPLPTNAYQLLKQLYKPKDDKKDEDRPDAGDEDDEPDAGVQSFAEGGVARPGYVFYTDDGDAVDLPNLGRVPVPAPDAIGSNAQLVSAGASDISSIPGHAPTDATWSETATIEPPGSVRPSLSPEQIAETTPEQQREYNSLQASEILERDNAGLLFSDGSKLDPEHRAQLLDLAVLDRKKSTPAVPFKDWLRSGPTVEPTRVGGATLPGSGAENAVAAGVSKMFSNLSAEPSPTQAPLGPDQTVPVREPLGPPPTWPGQELLGAGGSVGLEYRPGVTSSKAYRPGVDKGIEQAVAAKEKSALDVAAVEVDIAAQEQALAERREAMITEARESYLKEKAENDALVKRQADDIANTRIDPNALYARMSTGQRVASTIALVLGGLGGTVQGVGRGGWDGKNVALDMINRAIDLDVQAQRDNLENKKSVLAEYVRRGNDIEGAYNMTKAYLLDVAAAQIDKIAAQHKGGVAAASAAGIAADIRIEGAKLRDEAMLRKTKIRYEPLLAQLEIDKAGVEEMKLRLAEQQQQMQQASIEDAKWRLFNRQATAEDAFLLEQLDPKIRDRLLPLRNGQWAQLALGSESAFKIRDRLAINAEGRNVLMKLLEIAQDPDHSRRLAGFNSVARLLATEDMINKIRGSGLGAYDKGLATFLESWATDPEKFFARLDVTIANIKEKIRLNEEGENEFLDSVLFSPRQASSGVKVLGRASTGGR